MSDAALSMVAGEARPNRGRPRDEEKNHAILEAAVSLFLHQGYDATSMDEVAKKAGVSKQTVYSHFEGKEGLFSAAIRNHIDEHSVQDALNKLDQHTLEADLTAVATAFARLLLSPEAIDMFRLLVAGAPKGPELAQRFWVSGPESMLEELGAFLQGWVDKGELAIDNVELAAMQMIALLKGGLHFKLTIGLFDNISEETFRSHVDNSVRLFLKSYRA